MTYGAHSTVSLRLSARGPTAQVSLNARSVYILLTVHRHQTTGRNTDRNACKAEMRTLPILKFRESDMQSTCGYVKFRWNVPKQRFCSCAADSAQAKGTHRRSWQRSVALRWRLRRKSHLAQLVLALLTHHAGLFVAKTRAAGFETPSPHPTLAKAYSSALPQPGSL